MKMIQALHLLLSFSLLSLPSCRSNPVDPALSESDPFGDWIYMAGTVDGKYEGEASGVYCVRGHLRLRTDSSWEEQNSLEGFFLPIGGNFSIAGDSIRFYRDGSLFKSGTFSIAHDPTGSGPHGMRLRITSHPRYNADYTLIKRM